MKTLEEREKTKRRTNEENHISEEESKSKDIIYNRINFSPNKSKRAASIQVVESAIMIEVPNEFFTTVVMNIIKKDMEEKLRLLTLQPIFDVAILFL